KGDEPTPTPSSDATLKSLTVAGQTVDLAAAATEDGASLTVDDPTAVKASDVVFEANDSGATAKVNVNDGVVTVIVTAADGKTTETYTVKLVKKTVPVESIAIFGDGVAEGKLALETGKSVKLTATVTPTDADDAAVSWSVEGDAVTVDKTGLVKAVKAGTATVTATAGGKTASITVTVTDPVVPPAPSVDSVAITGSEVKDGKLELKVGGEATLTADVTVTGDIAKTVTWTSSDE
ncbi:MAG TPA: glycosyl hydrolase, partial [Bifidobacterium longum]|nr:glycosyl hydrolase [Bifidobacterium longum]